MPILTLKGTWYGGGCAIYNSAQYGDYANLGNVSHSNHSIIWGSTYSQYCGGWGFEIKDNISNQIIFTWTSVIKDKDLGLFYDGQQQQQSPKFDCINGACIPYQTYNTPGQYSSLEECQANCGNGQECPPCCIYKVECN